MDKKEACQDKLQAQLDEWKAEIAKLRATADDQHFADVARHQIDDKFTDIVEDHAPLPRMTVG